MKIAILCPDFPPDRSGLADHTAALAENLAAHADVTVITSRREGSDSGVGRVRALRQIPEWGWQGQRTIAHWLREIQPDWLIVQYVPHMYGRAGLNLALPCLLWWWRWRGGKILLLVHELYIPWSCRGRVDFSLPRSTQFQRLDRLKSILLLKRIAAGIIQRLMLAMSITAAPCIGVSTQVWQQKLARRFPLWRSRFHHIPIPSNVPVGHGDATERAEIRNQLGFAPDELVLGFFGTLHDSKLMPYVIESLDAVRACGPRVRLLCIGPTRHELAATLKGARPWSDQIVCTGYVEASRVSQYLSLTDIFLLPLIDGVSSRRGSLMAAISHGVPVVATSGEGTDEVLLNSPALVLSPVGDKAAFLKNVCLLAVDEARRRQLGEAGKTMYHHHYSWPVVTRQVLTLLEAEG